MNTSANARAVTEPPAGSATPTRNSVPLRRGDFATLADALDYAAQGVTGANFYAGGKLATVLPYAQLRPQARALARRLLALPLERGARVAMVAETSPDFVRFFFACQYAGLIPVALPSVVNLGGHAAFVTKMRHMLRGCGAAAALASAQFAGFLEEASAELDLVYVGTPAALAARPDDPVELEPTGPDEIAYLQFTSGSTGFPKAAAITAREVLANLFAALNYGIDVRADDRFVSWLPFYHDMGLIGCLLSVMASQRSVDYLDTREFAMRPRRWLDLLSQSGGTIAYSPPFGYELCTLRVRPADVAGYDLSRWRVAGIGAAPIRPELPEKFAEMLAPAGFDRRAFVPSYGMAETSVAISFAPLQRGVAVDWIDADALANELRAVPVAAGQGRGFVRCGAPLPGHAVKICDDAGHMLPAPRVGRIKVRGPSVMSGYFDLPDQSHSVLSEDGWLDTGDIGYLSDGEIVITGRCKDMIIINGCNIWPQDIEYIAERQPELRSTDASAFGVPGPTGEEEAVVVVQCNLSDPLARAALVQRIRQQVHEELGISCIIELVPRHTLPRTSSGKLSRSATRTGYLQRRAAEQAATAVPTDAATVTARAQ